MIKLPVLYYDCKHFLGDRPCFANKKHKVLCENCEHYEKDENIAEGYPTVKPCPSIKKLRRILIIKLDAIGDVLRTTSILPSLYKKYPGADIDWITKENSVELLGLAGYIKILFSIPGKINLQDYDLAINLDSGKESCEIMNGVEAKFKLGFGLINGKPYPLNPEANEWYLMGVDDNTKRLNKKSYHKIIHEVCGLKYEGSKPFLRNAENSIKSLSKKYKDGLGYHNYSDFLLVNVGGGNRWQNKKWTKEGYSGLINTLSAGKKDLLIGVIAGEEDSLFYEEVCSMVNKKNNIRFLGCNNTIKEFVSMVNISHKVLTSDSLGLHIATALGKFVVVLVGPTSPAELDVFGNGKILTSNKLECKCYYSSICTEQINCMNTIEVDEVIEALDL